jgi:acetyl esterase
MPVLPELEPLLARIRAAGPPERATPVAQRREQVHTGIDLQQAHMVEPVRALAYIDHTLPVAGGEIAIRVYRPEGRERVGCHLFVHGGGWWMGTLDQSDLACSRVAREVDCGVASVGHRWAPEHRFPVPAEDCYAALEWLATSAAELGLDAERISVGGISSGANLAAAITLMARDRGGPTIIAQSLEVPILDLTLSTASNEALADGYMLTRERLELEVADYCDPQRRAEPYASPLLAKDLTGLPPTLIATAEYDLLRDDGERYAARLRAAGNSATALRWAGHLHGSLGLTRLVASASEWHERQHRFLCERHELDRSYDRSERGRTAAQGPRQVTRLDNGGNRVHFSA